MDGPHPDQNKLLSALDKDVKARLFPFLELVQMPLSGVVYEAEEVMAYAYFPTDAIVSILYVMENGASAEIAVVGNDGMVGVSLFMGGMSTSSRAIVQSAGSAYRLHRGRFKTEFDRHTGLMVLLLAYSQCLITQMVQTAACNRHHSTRQQLCRWLLLSLDRLPVPVMTMTEKLICNMLGVTPETMREAAGSLQSSGTIRYQQGRITVLDRPQLEALCCECYTVVKVETDRLLPPSSASLSGAAEASARHG